MERIYNVDWIKDSIVGNLERNFGCTLDEATEEQIYQAVALTVRDQIMDKFVESRHLRHAEKSRRVYYLSVEFLMGRALHNNILNLMRTKDYQQALSELNISMDAIAEQESDPGLGNGGLGRLAACFLDSLATLDMPAMGCSIRYEYGLFRQKIIDGNYAPGFYVKHFIKDMNIALEEAADRGLPLDVLKLVRDKYDALNAQGGGDEGTQALIQVIRK